MPGPVGPAACAWWQTDDFWQYALYAAVAYIRAAASRTGATVRQVCQNLTPASRAPGAITTTYAPDSERIAALRSTCRSAVHA